MTSTRGLRKGDASTDKNHETSKDYLSKSLVDQQEALLVRESALEERLFWLETIVNSVPAGLSVKDAQGRFIFCNPVVRESHSLDLSDTLIGKTDFDLHAPVIAQEFFDLDQKLLNSGKSLVGVEQEIMTPDGHSRSILVSKIPVYDATGMPTGIVGFSYDISNRKETETLMLGHANMFGMLARSVSLEEIVNSVLLLFEEQLPGAIGSLQMLLPDGLHLSEPIAPSLPHTFRDMLGRTAIGSADASGRTGVWSGETVITEDILTDPLWSALAETAASAGIRSSWSAPVLSYKGEVLGAFSVYTSLAATPKSSQSDVIAMTAYMLGIAIERKHSEERLQFLAHHDTLTGLANRARFHECLSSSLDAARKNDARITLAFLDLDNFKQINDTLGHDAGDQVLKTVAERATAFCRKPDIVARLGGDEFVIIMLDFFPGSDAGQNRLHNLQKAISAPVTLSGRSLKITFSMGVACFPDHGESPAVLLANADLAMYRAKAAGRNNLKTFSWDMAEKSNATLFG